jgi:Uncharacterized protein conserved in bacteria
MPSFLENFESNTYKNDSTSTIRTEQPSKPERGGVKVTEHQVVFDKSYNRNKLIRISIYCGIVIVFIVIGLLIFSSLSKVIVPNFKNKTLAEAQAWATKNSVELDTSYKYDMKVDSDIVITQSVSADKKISKGDMLKLTVSSGANPDEKISVPEFSDMTAAKIQAWIDDNKLTNTTISEENSDTIASGGFIKATYRDVSTDKDNFKRKDYLTITVSKGPSVATGDVTMSNLVGETKTDAESWASTNGVNLVTTTVTSKTVAADNVISQDVKTGAIVKSGGSVNIVLSGGTGIKVPSFKTIAMNDAQNKYSDFAVTVKQRYSSTIAYGNYISQSVASGTYVLATNNKIEVTYSIGKPYLDNLAGTSEKDLPSYFDDFIEKGAKISYNVTYTDSDTAKGTIISTSKYCEYLSMNETITIVVSNGSKTTQEASGNSNSNTTNNNNTSSNSNDNTVAGSSTQTSGTTQSNISR